jgi:hypothetical protein
LSFDYLAHEWDLKAEYNYHKTPALFTQYTPQTTDIKSKAFYVQLAHDIGKFTPFARYDHVITDTAQSGDPSYYQRIYVIGLGYKLSDNVNLRLEQDFNHGYALAVPEMIDPATGLFVNPVNPSLNWRTSMVSANFMF